MRQSVDSVKKILTTLIPHFYFGKNKSITSLLNDTQQAHQNKPIPCTSSFTIQCQKQQQKNKPSAFVYDDDDNQPKQGSSELGDCRLPFAVPDSVNSKVKSTSGSQLERRV